MLRTLCFFLLIQIAISGVFKISVKKHERNAIKGRWQKNDLESEPLYDFSREYLGDVYFGSPPQHFRLLFDSGSANTWITDNECDCDCHIKLTCEIMCRSHCCKDLEFISNSATKRDSKVCKDKNRFDRKNSSTYHADGTPFEIKYSTGSVSGVLGKDLMTLNGDLSIPNVVFGQADILDKSFQTDPLDGVLGLAFQSLAVDNVVPPINQALADGLLDDPLFTVWLKNSNSIENGKESGTITFGDLDGDHCGFIQEYINLTAEKHWQFSVKKITIQDEFITSGWTAISSTGNPFIGLPRPLLDKIVAVSGATFDKKKQYWKVNCNANFNVLFTFDELDYTVSSKNMIYNLGKNDCQLLVKETTDPSIQIILGNPFNQALCVIYDYSGKIGFAKSLVK